MRMIERNCCSPASFLSLLILLCYSCSLVYGFGMFHTVPQSKQRQQQQQTLTTTTTTTTTIKERTENKRIVVLSAVPKVFIDGEAGTTGLQVRDRLGSRNDIDVLSIPEDLRKDEDTRRKLINEADVVILCKCFSFPFEWMVQSGPNVWGEGGGGYFVSKPWRPLYSSNFGYTLWGCTKELLFLPYCCCCCYSVVCAAVPVCAAAVCFVGG